MRFLNLVYVDYVVNFMNLESVDFDFAEIRKASNNPPSKINVGFDVSNFSVKGDLVKFYFRYTVSYLPDSSFIRLGGFANFRGSDAVAESKDWIKNKKLSGPAGEAILSMLNYTASLNTVFIARVFNMTPPISPPSIKMSQKPAVPNVKSLKK